MLFYPYYFDPLTILYPFFIIGAIMVIIAIIIIIMLVKSIRKNMKEVNAKQKTYRYRNEHSSQPPRPSQAIYQQPTTPVSSSTTSSIAYCKFCGEKVARDAAFCPNCGSKL